MNKTLALAAVAALAALALSAAPAGAAPTVAGSGLCAPWATSGAGMFDSLGSLAQGAGKSKFTHDKVPDGAMKEAPRKPGGPGGGTAWRLRRSTSIST